MAGIRGNTIDLKAGERFGRWSVLHEVEVLHKAPRVFQCRCDCGNMKVVSLVSLIHNRSKSCGCWKSEKLIARKEKIAIGTVFNYWTVLEKATPTKHRTSRFKCECKCGTVKILELPTLKKGKSKSCGCYNKEVIQKRKQSFEVGTMFYNWEYIKEGPTKHPHRNRTLTCKCVCGFVKDVDYGLLRAGVSKSCGCLHLNHRSQSSQEQEIIDFLLSQGLAKSEDVIQGDRKLLGGKEIDIYLPKHKVGIEYNGNYWHSEENRKDKNIHFHKRLLAEKAGIRLIQIRSDEWEQKSDLVKSMLKNILGLSDNVYYARKLNVRAVLRGESDTFLKANHLMGAYSSGRSIGLFTEDGILVQIFVYKLLKSKTELHCSRICSLKNVTVVGGVSRLIKYAVESHPLVKTIVSFVDLRYADGHSLIAQGFVLKSTTLGFGWTDGKHCYNRLRCKANMDERKLTQAQHAEELGWFKLWDAGQAKFEKLI